MYCFFFSSRRRHTRWTGDWSSDVCSSDLALAYAEHAFRLRPQTPWVVHSLFDMQAQIGQWKAAQETLDSGLRRKVVTQDKGRTLKALLLVERSRAAERDGGAADALALAREAFGLAPERLAVSSRLAELQIKA